MSENLFQELFAGEILSISTRPATTKIVAAGRAVVIDSFGADPSALSADEFREALAQARETVGGTEFFDLAKDCLPEFGFDLAGLQLDRVRFRALTPGLENIPEAAAVFHCHRDTWYGNPSCQINAWIPLHEVNERNSFRFYPDYFRQAIPNDSASFVAADFESEGGFGRVSPKNDSSYPKNLQAPQGSVFDVRLPQGHALLFSAAHLHQSLVNRSGRVRYSLDFRFYHREHLQMGLGAPDPDNKSVGLLIKDYRSCD